MGTNMRDTRQVIGAVAQDKRRGLIDPSVFFSQMPILLGEDEWREVRNSVESTVKPFISG